jgi:hypothetical protein
MFWTMVLCLDNADVVFGQNADVFLDKMLMMFFWTIRNACFFGNSTRQCGLDV